MLCQLLSASACQFDNLSLFQDLKGWQGRTLIQRLAGRAIAESVVKSLRISMLEVPPPLPVFKLGVKVNFAAVQPGNCLHLLLVKWSFAPRCWHRTESHCPEPLSQLFTLLS
ncbi:hypothetical protein BDBG_17608 [Blastomyces gilchristii SLH14081]|uniref:Uncharacterized protein n=1 Tax=Blastomyces gilchristii (strain SLH14081) TaxID=559298 RepID=A0A179UXY9_BLAGS|nr:uncharacterized protein BDBG_17608 [Blastomyces gilchristii SLH14081]OAT11998.1 hypothetical protein BDBG_17608 [Blastomyces gilchristii SLH14081]